MIPVTAGCLATNGAILLGILTLGCTCTPPTLYTPLLRLFFLKRLHIKCGEIVTRHSKSPVFALGPTVMNIIRVIIGTQYLFLHSVTDRR